MGASQDQSTQEKRVLVCGGRGYSLVSHVNTVLREVGPDLLICGGAPGADRLAIDYAANHGIPCMVFPAAWTHLGRRAGPTRNAWMIRYGEPTIVVAFPGGAGTSRMVELAKEAGVPINMVEPWPGETL